jgi:hypothetical protein
MTGHRKTIAAQLSWLLLRWLLIREVRRRTRGAVARVKQRSAQTTARWRGRRGLAVLGLGAIAGVVATFLWRRRV